MLPYSAAKDFGTPRFRTRSGLRLVSLASAARSARVVAARGPCESSPHLSRLDEWSPKGILDHGLPSERTGVGGAGALAAVEVRPIFFAQTFRRLASGFARRVQKHAVYWVALLV